MPILRVEKRSNAQISRLYAIARKNLVDSGELGQLIEQMGYEDPADLSTEDYEALCDVVLPAFYAQAFGCTDPDTGEIYEL